MNIEQLELEHLNRVSKEHFQALYQISQILNKADYEDYLIDEALDWVIKVINAERGVFAKYDTEKKDFHIINARNLRKESITDLSEFLRDCCKE